MADRGDLIERPDRRELIDPRPEPPSARPGPGSFSSKPRHSFANDVIGTTVLLLLCGLWLIVSPRLLPYTEDDVLWLPVVAGSLIATVAILRILGVRWLALNFFVIAVAIALGVAGVVVADSDVALWNACGSAAIALFLASAAAAAAENAQVTGGRGF